MDPKLHPDLRLSLEVGVSVLGHSQVIATLSCVVVACGLLSTPELSFVEASQDLPLEYMRLHRGCSDHLCLKDVVNTGEIRAWQSLV